MNTAERWKEIPETGGRYEVSSFGKIRNRITGIVRKPYAMPNGYLTVHYNMNGKFKRHYIHRLVAEAFCSHSDGCDIVNHIDNDKSNNYADNLEWTTQYGNVHHGMEQRRYRLNARPVIGCKDETIYRYQSANHAGAETGCDPSSILKCCKGKYKHTHGYTWKFAEVVAG